MGEGEEVGGGGGGVPFLRAFCFSCLRWAAAGLRVRSLSLAILEGGLSGCGRRFASRC